MRQLRILDVTADGCCLALYGDLVLHYHMMPSMDESLARFLRILDSAKRSRKRAALLVVGAAVRSPSESTRVLLHSFLTKYSAHILASGILILGNRFSAATHRASMSRLRLNAPAPYPSDIFTEQSKAAAWLASCLDGHSSYEISSAITELMQPRRPAESRT